MKTLQRSFGNRPGTRVVAVNTPQKRDRQTLEHFCRSFFDVLDESFDAKLNQRPDSVLSLLPQRLRRGLSRHFGGRCLFFSPQEGTRCASYELKEGSNRYRLNLEWTVASETNLLWVKLPWILSNFGVANAPERHNQLDLTPRPHFKSQWLSRHTHMYIQTNTRPRSNLP